VGALVADDVVRMAMEPPVGEFFPREMLGPLKEPKDLDHISYILPTF
jgi:hypothetical protein